MHTSSTLKLALELAAKVTGREELAALASEVSRMSDYAYRRIEPTSWHGASGEGGPVGIRLGSSATQVASS